MTESESEFQELVKDAPNFLSMDHAELVAYAYAMYVAGVKIDAENAELRELALRLLANLRNREDILELMGMPPSEAVKDEMRAIIDKCSELGIEVPNA